MPDDSPACRTSRPTRQRILAAAACVCSAAALSACGSGTAPAPAGAAESTVPVPTFSREPVEPVEPARPIDVAAFSEGGPLLAAANRLVEPTSKSTSLAMSGPELQPGQYTLTFACSSPDGTAVVTGLVRDPELNVLAVAEGECATDPKSSEHTVDFLVQTKGVEILLDTSRPGIALAGRVDSTAG